MEEKAKIKSMNVQIEYQYLHCNFFFSVDRLPFHIHRTVFELLTD